MLDDIRKAFSNFERSRDHSERVKFFQDALNQAKTILESNIAQSEKDKINDLKFIYTRKLLEQIGPEYGLTFPEDHWVDYWMFLDFDCKKEVDKLFFESVRDDMKALLRFFKN